jgi:hypothetical protein
VRIIELIAYFLINLLSLPAAAFSGRSTYKHMERRDFYPIAHARCACPFTVHITARTHSLRFFPPTDARAK